MSNTIILICFLIVNTFGVLFFSFDKFAAIKNKSRISEKILHIFEILGGIFTILILMYIIRHKNKKFSYYSISWLVFTAWIFLIYFVIKHQII